MVSEHARVNGNLNLSRSIGDLKYKQSKHLPQSEQIITSQPDITITNRSSSDEFIVIACDGIWDCMKSEQVIDFVRARRGKQSLSSICAEIFDTIISPSPTATKGIGGDNMTCIIIDLQQ
eukprot:c19519_g2_i2.p1 GENE.c19519_g2_i2~~c19519_g2_i2.p1  ORF type:complete len:120 (+),score=51.65 c19519_g2_i2:287-646(+)